MVGLLQVLADIFHRPVLIKDEVEARRPEILVQKQRRLLCMRRQHDFSGLSLCGRPHGVDPLPRSACVHLNRTHPSLCGRHKCMASN